MTAGLHDAERGLNAGQMAGMGKCKGVGSDPVPNAGQ